MSKTRTAIGYATIDSYYAAGLQFVAIVILARLLTPRETGIYGLAAALASLASVIRDFGVSEYLIQERELTADKIRAALFTNFLVSWVLASALLASSGAVAIFYGEPGVGQVLKLQAVGLFLIPFGAVTYAYLRRELEYRTIALAGVSSNTVAFAVTLGCAHQGLAYMSLAWGSLAGVLVSVAVALVARPATVPLMPGLRAVRAALQFGWHATGIYLAQQVGRHAPGLVIGRFDGAASVALFSRAGFMTELFDRLILAPALSVFLPHLASWNRERGDWNSTLLQGESYVVALGLPFFGCVAVLADPVVRVLFGDQWVASIPLVAVLAATGAVALTHCLAKETLLSLGRVVRAKHLAWWTQVLRLAGLAGGLWFGLLGASWGLLFAEVTAALMAYRFLRAAGGPSLRALVSALLPSIWVSLPPIACAWVTRELGGHYGLPMLAVLVIAAGVAVFAWFSAIRLLRHPLGAELRPMVAQIPLPWPQRRR